MIFDRQQQHLLLEGKEYTPEDIARFIAEGAENTPSALWDLYLFLNEWFNDSPVITVHTSGSTGTPKELIVRKDQMMQSARLTCEFLNLKQGESALLCMNLRYIGAMMLVVRALVAGLDLIVRPASGHPLSDVKQPLRFAAMVPLQVYNTLRTPANKFSDYLKVANINEVDKISNGEQALNNILQSISYLIGEERKILSIASQSGDEVTVSMMSDYLKEQEKLVWMLTAYNSK